MFEIDLHASQRSQKKAVDEEVVELPVEQFGRPRAPAGTWGSCVRIVDPIEVSR
jgi:splicing factor 3B subunit 3